MGERTKVIIEQEKRYQELRGLGYTPAEAHKLKVHKVKLDNEH